VAAHAASRRKQAERTLVERVKDFAGIWVELFRKHQLLTYASAIARTTIVATVSLVLLMLGVLGAIGRKDLWFTHIAPQIHKRVLPEVFAGINETVKHIFAANSPGLIVFASLLAIWEVSGSVRGVSGALNRIYESRETRPWKVRYPISLGIAAAIIAALLSAILLIMGAGGAVHGAGYVPFALVRWLGSVLLIMLAFGLLVRFAPARPRAKKWASLGAALVVVGWIVESLIFKWYVTSIADFRTAVGSLTVILVVVGYLYVGSIILLVGIELDELLREEGKEAERTVVHLARAIGGR
jgi:membrane protein